MNHLVVESLISGGALHSEGGQGSDGMVKCYSWNREKGRNSTLFSEPGQLLFNLLMWGNACAKRLACPQTQLHVLLIAFPAVRPSHYWLLKHLCHCGD